MRPVPCYLLHLLFLKCLRFSTTSLHFRFYRHLEEWTYQGKHVGISIPDLLDVFKVIPLCTVLHNVITYLNTEVIPKSSDM